MRKFFTSFLIFGLLFSLMQLVGVYAACGDDGTLAQCGVASQCPSLVNGDGLVACCMRQSDGTFGCSDYVPCDDNSALCPGGSICCSGGCQSGTTCDPDDIPDPDHLTCSSALAVGTQADCATGSTCVADSNEADGYGCREMGDWGDALFDWFKPLPPRIPYSGPTITDLNSVLKPLVDILFWSGLGLGMLFILYSGYQLMLSEGNPQKTKDGQEQLTSALLGTLFVLLSVTILRVIISTFFKVTL